MCKDCRDQIREVLIGLLSGEHELCEFVREEVHNGLEAAREAGKEIPEGMEEALIEAGIAGQVAVGAAHIAGMCDPDFTEEGGLDVPIILGMWAGTMMHARAEQHFSQLARQLLGMGDN